MIYSEGFRLQVFSQNKIEVESEQKVEKNPPNMNFKPDSSIREKKIVKEKKMMIKEFVWALLKVQREKLLQDKIQMCGICLILGGVSIHEHQFNFSFFSAYLTKQHRPFNQHIIENKLVLPPTLYPEKIKQKLKCRGPDAIVAHQVDLFKVNYRPVKIDELEEEHQVPKGEAFGVQSVLNLRGDHPYFPDMPGCYFLFNGQIWDSGNLPFIQNDQNDSEWFYRMLISCKGQKEKMRELLEQIRGDYAFIFMEGDEIFVGKDYFGKRSLLLGMGEDYFIFTSVPVHDSVRIIQPENAQDSSQEENQQSWKLKYEAQWLSSKNKFYYEVPPNSLINIRIDGKSGKVRWDGESIHKFELADLPKQPQITEQIIKANVKKLMIENLKEMTKCIQHVGEKSHPNMKIAVLFSGGIDSTLIARLLDFVLPKSQSIDLINLAFREDAPDRESGKIAFEQLKNLSPDREYNLILVDKNLEDVEKVKKELMETIYPKSTHMDFNISASLSIAASVTKSRIILTGLGADEIFSGYSRYRIAFKRAGFQELERQMIFDMERLWIRNLGRDDRAITRLSKEVRYPFLYMPLWMFLRTVPVQMLTEGMGEKMLLRSIAKDFGLEKSSQFKKRAIQFGTRLAKLSNVKCFGSNRKAKGNYEYK